MHSTVLFEALDRQSDVRHLLKRGSVKSRTYRIRVSAGAGSPRMIPIADSPSCLGEGAGVRRVLQGPLLRRVG